MTFSVSRALDRRRFSIRPTTAGTPFAGSCSATAAGHRYDWLPKLDATYDIPRAFELMQDGKMHSDICQGCNPPMSIPDKNKVRASLAKLKFPVTMDPLETESSRCGTTAPTCRRRKAWGHSSSRRGDGSAVAPRADVRASVAGAHEPFVSPVTNVAFPKVRGNPAARVSKDDRLRFGDATDFPYAGTTNRLTELFRYRSTRAKINAVLQPEFFIETGDELAKGKGVAKVDWIRVPSKRCVPAKRGVRSPGFADLGADDQEIAHKATIKRSPTRRCR